MSLLLQVHLSLINYYENLVEKKDKKTTLHLLLPIVCMQQM